MSSKGKIYLVVLIWVVIAVQIIVNKTVKDDDEIVEAFSISNSIPITSSLDAYGLFGEMYLNDDTKENMLVNLAGELGITDGYTIDKESSSELNKTVLIKNGKQGNTKVSIVTVNNEDGEGVSNEKQYILISIELNSSPENIMEIRDKVDEIYNDIGVDNSSNIYLKGSIAGELTQKDKVEMIDSVFDDLEARVVLSNTLDTTYNVYGYTKNEKSYVYQMGEKVNVNMAISYDENENMTYIHIASPFINKSF